MRSMSTIPDVVFSFYIENMVGHTHRKWCLFHICKQVSAEVRKRNGSSSSIPQLPLPTYRTAMRKVNSFYRGYSIANLPVNQPNVP